MRSVTYDILNNDISSPQRFNMRGRLHGLLVAFAIATGSVVATYLFIAVIRINRLPNINTQSTAVPTMSPFGHISNPTPTPKSASDSSQLVDLGYVKYTGTHNSISGINYYRGIPYAVAPTGENRWQPPRSIENENGFNGRTIAADHFGPSCYQVCFPGPCEKYKDQSEDCLTLDVLVPDKPVSTRLPVVVMIHGGGYYLGNSQLPGDAIVHSSKGQIIYVSIQYRLGIFGFLAGSEIRNDGVANAGLLDQRCALDWVSRNIRAFGGDPSQITIWGGSAGGGSVVYQIMAYGGTGTVPFRAAIPEYPWHPPLLNESSQDAVYRTALGLSRCNGLNCLREISPEALQDINNDILGMPSDFVGSNIFMHYGPVVDGNFVKDLPTQAFKSGRFHNVPTLINHNMYEGYIFTPQFENQVEETTDAKAIFPSAGPSFFSRLYQLYPISAFNNTFWQRQAWFGDFIINCPTYCFASSMIDQNRNSTAVFKMLFDAGSHVHGATLAFLLSEDINYPLAGNRFLAEVMPSYWISFIVTMDPNPLRSKRAPFWPSYEADGAGTEESGEGVGFDVMTVREDIMFVETDEDASSRCDFFMANSDVIRN